MDIRTRILARNDLGELVTGRDLDGIKAKLDAEGVTVQHSRFITARVVRTLPDGKAILAALKAARALDDDIDLAYTFLMQGAGLDIGDDTSLEMIDELAEQGVFEQAWAEQIKGLAMFPLLVDRLDVEAAVNEILGSDTA